MPFQQAFGQSTPSSSREAPARTLPVPDAVSPQMQAIVGRPLNPSNTVRMHRKLRSAGVEAVLQVWEGQSHAQYMHDIAAPETKEYHDEVARFFDLRLGRRNPRGA